jgi:hypothetical protein
LATADPIKNSVQELGKIFPVWLLEDCFYYTTNLLQLSYIYRIVVGKNTKKVTGTVHTYLGSLGSTLTTKEPRHVQLLLVNIAVPWS